MARSRDDEGNEVEIDERYFMEWVELGLGAISTRLAAEWRLDEIDRRKKEEADGSQEKQE